MSGKRKGKTWNLSKIPLDAKRQRGTLKPETLKFGEVLSCILASGC